MKRILKILLTSLQEQTGKASIKRVAILSLTLMMFYIVIVHTNKDNAVSICGIVSSLLGALTGVTAYFSLKDKEK